MVIRISEILVTVVTGKSARPALRAIRISAQPTTVANRISASLATMAREQPHRISHRQSTRNSRVRM
jgi:hypothetical protein